MLPLWRKQNLLQKDSLRKTNHKSSSFPSADKPNKTLLKELSSIRKDAGKSLEYKIRKTVEKHIRDILETDGKTTDICKSETPSDKPIRNNRSPNKDAPKIQGFLSQIQKSPEEQPQWKVKD